ncbi:glycosyltransferase [Paenibacillus sp. NPDC056579]|uniref:glycosyltransferase n=1 Tax=Paenibacillus sp. NPDC056579 TaxID=3345871 RepID=UPI0036857859
MKNILIASYDMEVGGVERSLISMLDHFDYASYAVDLMLYKHQGDFMELLSSKARLLHEMPQYATFRQSIPQTFRNKQYGIGISRILSKLNADLLGRMKHISEPGYYQMQLMWKYALPYLPKLDKSYDVAISYLWPHDFVAEKVKARKKIAWIHTDYSNVETDIRRDLRMWSRFDRIMAVSEACRSSFLHKYSELTDRTVVMENITSPDFVRKMAEKEPAGPLTEDKRFKILTVARLSHAKGIDNAVRALKLLKDRGYNDIAWYVVGYGGDEAMVRELIAANGLTEQFVLLGKKTNPYPYMKACDLYVQPSRYEGKAVTVTEAQILGRPILITNYPTAASQVEHEVDGYICDLNVEGIAAGIERLYHQQELREQLTRHTNSKDYSNTYEMEKLYGIIV